MGLLLPAACRDALLREAAAAGAAECCGLLLGARRGAAAEVAAVLPVRNLASAPAREFLLDPEPLARALREGRRGGPRVLGVYHSHPASAARPSARDAAEAWPEWSWLIVGRDARGARELRSFRRPAAAAPLVEEPLVVAPPPRRGAGAAEVRP